MYARTAGIELTHIPYRGGGPAMIDVLGGNLPAVAGTLPNILASHKQGKIRMLAYTNDKPLASIVDVPTFAQAGYPDLVVTENFGVYASAKTPEPVLTELNRLLNAAAARPRTLATLAKLEFEPLALSRDAFAARVKAEQTRWGPIVKATGFRAED